MNHVTLTGQANFPKPSVLWPTACTQCRLHFSGQPAWALETSGGCPWLPMWKLLICIKYFVTCRMLHLMGNWCGLHNTDIAQHQNSCLLRVSLWIWTKAEDFEATHFLTKPLGWHFCTDLLSTGRKFFSSFTCVVPWKHLKKFFSTGYVLILSVSQRPVFPSATRLPGQSPQYSFPKSDSIQVLCSLWKFQNTKASIEMVKGPSFPLVNWVPVLIWGRYSIVIENQDEFWTYLCLVLQNCIF